MEYGLLVGLIGSAVCLGVGVAVKPLIDDILPCFIEQMQSSGTAACGPTTAENGGPVGEPDTDPGAPPATPAPPVSPNVVPSPTPSASPSPSPSTSPSPSATPTPSASP